MGIFESIKNSINITLIEESRYLVFLEGLGNTLLITILAAILGIALGSIVAFLKSMSKGNKKLILVEKLCNIYVTVIRGTPVVVQLFITYFIIFATQRNGLIAAVVAFGVNSGAYVAEIIRGGLESIDKGQYEAGRSLGLSQGKTMIYVIFPQAFKNILPSLANEFISLLKETSVVGFIAIKDLTRAQNIVTSRTLDFVFPLFMVAGIYLFLVMIMTYFVNKLEKRLAISDSN